MLRSVLQFAFIALCIMASLAPVSARAQGVEPGGIDLDIESMLFPNTKPGCEMRTSFTYAMTTAYKDGQSPTGIANFKMMEPLVTKIFDQIKANGITETNLQLIRDYKSCISGAKPVSNREKELLLTSKHDGCTKFADAMLGTMEGIKGRQKLETIQSRYGQPIDFIDTGYEDFMFQGQEMPLDDLKNPMPGIINNLHSTAQSQSYDAAVAQGTALVVGCFMTR